MKLPKKNLKDLYYATVHSNLLYGIEIYANIYKTNLTELIILNNKVLRILQCKVRSTCTSELYVEYNTVSLDKLFTY